MAIEGYNDAISKIEKSMEDFITEAKSGSEGRGSKASALRARKLSSEITRQLKDFRKISVENDRGK